MISPTTNPGTVLLLTRGAVRVALPGADDRQVLAALVQAPAMLGIEDAVAGSSTGSEVVSLSEVEGILIPADALLTLMRLHTSVATAVTREIAVRLLRTQQLLRSAALAEVTSRLAQLLLAYARLDATSASDGSGLRVSTRLSQDSLARDLGVSRNAVRHGLASLSEFVTKQRGRFVVHDEVALRNRAVASPDVLAGTGSA